MSNDNNNSNGNQPESQPSINPGAQSLPKPEVRGIEFETKPQRPDPPKTETK